MAGERRYVYGNPEEFFLDVNPEHRKCVVFIGYKTKKGQERVAGTGFLVSRPSVRFPQLRSAYIVTARHVIEELQGSDVFVWLNRKDDRQIVQAEPWIMHDDEDVDVAVCPFDISEEFDHRCIPWNSFLVDRGDPEYARYGNMPPRYTIGDDVMITGLFFQHPGRARNIPIIRVGNLATLREEPVYTQVGIHPKRYAYIDAYLVENRSQSGLSGSPAFLYETRHANTGILFQPDRLYSPKENRPIHFLGMIQGYFEGLVPIVRKSSKEDQVNVGISVVIPAQRIIEVFRKTDIADYESRKDEEQEADNAAVVSGVNNE